MLFPCIPSKSYTFHLGALTSFTSVFHTSYNVFHGTHGKQTCKFEVKLSASKPSEPSDARRARLQSITLSGMLTYMKPESGVCEKNTHVQRKPCAPQTPFPFYKVEHGDVECPGVCEINTHFCRAVPMAE